MVAPADEILTLKPVEGHLFDGTPAVNGKYLYVVTKVETLDTCTTEDHLQELHTLSRLAQSELQKVFTKLTDPETVVKATFKAVEDVDGLLALESLYQW